MEEHFIPFELAKQLKEAGFKEPCFAYYEISDKLQNKYRLRYVEHEPENPLINNEDSPHVAAPLYEQVFDWFIHYKALLLTRYPLYSASAYWRVEIINITWKMFEFDQTDIKGKENAYNILIQEALKIIQ